MIEISLKPKQTKPAIYFLSGIENFGESYQHWRLTARSPIWRPPTDVYETEEVIIIRIEIAGMQEEEFSIIVDGKILSVRGFRSDVAEKRAYHQMEIRFGEFVSEMELPYDVDSDKIEAEYSTGFLRITLPKLLPKHISVQE